MGGVVDSGRTRGPGRRGQEDKDEEDERTRMRRTWMILQDSIIKLHDVTKRYIYAAYKKKNLDDLFLKVRQ